jgi:hypothetical protein
MSEEAELVHEDIESASMYLATRSLPEAHQRYNETTWKAAHWTDSISINPEIENGQLTS